MNKTVAGVLAGLLFGAVATWLLFPRTPPADPGESTPTPSAVASSDQESGSIHLSVEQRQHAGLKVAPPQAGDLMPEREAFGRVLDSMQFVMQAADVDAARAALTTAESELARTEKLHADGGNASAQSVETAQAAVANARARFASARVTLLGTWGSELVTRDDRAALIDALESRTQALVRIDVPAGNSSEWTPPTARAGLIGESALHPIAIIGPAPTTDPQIQGRAYLATWSGDPPPAGAALRALVPTEAKPQSVWYVPRSALIRHQGSVFVYEQTADDTFKRQRVELGEPRENDVPVVAGLTGKEPIVVAGAQQLLSTELDAGGEPE